MTRRRRIASETFLDSFTNLLQSRLRALVSCIKTQISHCYFQGFTVRGAPGANSPGGAGALYPALCVGGAALAAAACVALAVARRRDRAPAAQGFVQVDTAVTAL